MFHLSVKPISRAAGRSATAAAAYRSGQLIADERTGEVHDYTRKSDVVHSEILVPPGAPAWAEDRTALWNSAEAAEKRKDARVARDYEVAIPKELTREQGIELVRDFAQGLADRYGVAVDFNVHRDELRNWDGSEKGWQGYHAHVLTSTRKLGREGFGDKAAIELSDAKRKSLGLVDGAAEIEQVRQLWEIAANRHLERAGAAQRIDRRSLRDQGIDREPTVHLGPWVTALERDGIASRLGDLNREAMAEGKMRAEKQQALRELDRQIGALEPEFLRGTVARALTAKAEPAKRERPSRAQQLKGLDFSGLAQFAAEQEARERREKDLAADLEQRIRERDQRVRRVLAKAQRRQVRREEFLRRVVESRPEGPKGLLAKLQQKGHQQATAAWERARELATRLAQQAQQLAEHLRDIADPEHVRRWAKGVVERAWPPTAQHARKVEPKQQRELAPGRQRSLPQPEPELVRIHRQSWGRVRALLEKAKTAPLSLPEKREVVRGWDGLVKLVDAGHQPASPDERRSIIEARLQAHRQVAAAVFLNMPPADVVREFPQLAGALTMLETIDRKAQAEGLTLEQRRHVLERSRQRIVQAIEKGESLQMRFKEQARPERPSRRDRDFER